jgi:hypothetical protein
VVVVARPTIPSRLRNLWDRTGCHASSRIFGPSIRFTAENLCQRFGPALHTLGGVAPSKGGHPASAVPIPELRARPESLLVLQERGCGYIQLTMTSKGSLSGVQIGEFGIKRNGGRSWFRGHSNQCQETAPSDPFRLWRPVVVLKSRRAGCISQKGDTNEAIRS